MRAGKMKPGRQARMPSRGGDLDARGGRASSKANRTEPNCRRRAGPARLRPKQETKMAVSANRLELLQIADAVARGKSIDWQIVLASMEDAIQKAARSRYGQETGVGAEINPKTG